MEEIKIPEYLYHYTSIDTLKLILMNRTIRFTCLTEVDDLEEAQSADIKNIGQINYVSCWNGDENENTAMWGLYASLKNGVRIKLPVYPFEEYEYPLSEIYSVLNTKCECDPQQQMKFTLPILDLLGENIISPNFLIKTFFIK